MDGCCRHVTKWNEAKIDPAHLENVLDIMQAKQVLVNIKYESAQPLNKTPLILMANNDVFPNEEDLISDISASIVKHVHYLLIIGSCLLNLWYVDI